MRPRTAIFLGLALAALGLTLGGQPAVPPVFLNHISIVLPSSVYAELRESSFLKNEFSATAERTNTAQNDGVGTYSYTGIYLRGRQTYLECFETATQRLQSEQKAGDIVFNLSIDNRDQLPLLRDRLAAEMGAPMQIELIRNSQSQPNYQMVTREGGLKNVRRDGVTAVVKAYYPDGITRSKRGQASYLPDHLLQDVAGITMTVNQAESRELLQMLSAFGYAIHKDSEKQIASGPEVTFTLLPEKPNTPRILVLDLSLNREKTGEQNYKFGDGSELQFHGNSAKWTFTFPTN
jgi:hypothetical protein